MALPRHTATERNPRSIENWCQVSFQALIRISVIVLIVPPRAAALHQFDAAALGFVDRQRRVVVAAEMLLLVIDALHLGIAALAQVGLEFTLVAGVHPSPPWLGPGSPKRRPWARCGRLARRHWHGPA